MNLLITFEDLTKATPIGGNVDTDRYKHCILDAQNSKLKELIGDTLYSKIDSDYTNTALSGNYLTLYDEFIKPIVIHQSAVEYLGVASYQVSNGGIYKHTPQNGTPVEVKDVEFLINIQRLKVEQYVVRMNRWLSRVILPEYIWHYENIVNPNRGGAVFDFDFISNTKSTTKSFKSDNRFD